MDIAFYAPLKSPEHPVPSGDRRMARALMDCLRRGGHRVRLISGLRAYVGDPGDAGALAEVTAHAQAERERITHLWRAEGPPDLWLCYHPYYKAPDLLGPTLCAAHGVAYGTVETSYSARRNTGIWAGMQAGVLAGIGQAAVNICLTARDEAGLREACPDARVARMPPFIDLAGLEADPAPEPRHLVTVAMMRAGDKRESYGHLAAALAQVEAPWHLSVVGAGPLEAEVRGLFDAFAADRVRWLGLLDPQGVAGVLQRGAIYVWPGCGEAYGLAYLEAQAAGLPVVAYRTAGVPEVVADGRTGVLVADRDDRALARAVDRLLGDDALRARMAQAARGRVRAVHSIDAAVEKLGAILRDHLAEVGRWTD